MDIRINHSGLMVSRRALQRFDLVGNNVPVSFISDTIKIRDILRSTNPNSNDNLQSNERFFEFISHVPEGANTVAHLYSSVVDQTGYQTMGRNSFRAFNRRRQSESTQLTQRLLSSQTRNP
jgi:catalase